MSKRREKLGCIVAALGLFTLSIVFLIRPTESAVSYHNNILAAYPSGFTFLLYGTLIISMLLLAVGSYKERWRTVIIAGLIYLMWMALFYVLHSPTGYIFGTPSSDSLYHLGIIQTTIETGTIVENQVYPASYALMTIMAIIADPPLMELVVMLAFPFRLVFLLGVTLLGRRFWGTRGFATVFLAAIPFVFGRYIRTMHPFFYAFSLLPIVLLMYDQTLRINRMSRKRLITVLLFLVGSIVFLHPMTAIYLVVICLCWAIGYYLSNRKGISDSLTPINNLPAITLFFIAAWITFHNILLESSAGILVANFLPEDSSSGGEESEPIISVFMTALEESPASIGTLIYEIVIIEYGAALIYGGLGGILTVWVAYQTFQREARPAEVSIAAVYVGGCIIGIVFLVTYVIAANPIRVGLIGLLFAILLLGGVLNTAAQDQRKAVYSALVVIIAISGVISGGMVYTPNSQMQPTTIEGVEWSHEFQDPDYPSETQFDKKLSYYILGYNGVLSDQRRYNQFHDSSIPTHIGYDNHDRVSERLSQRTYIVLTERDISRHQAYSKERWSRFPWLIEDKDQDLLNNDPGASKVYTSEQYWVWSVENDSQNESR